VQLNNVTQQLLDTDRLIKNTTILEPFICPQCLGSLISGGDHDVEWEENFVFNWCTRCDFECGTHYDLGYKYVTAGGGVSGVWDTQEEAEEYLKKRGQERRKTKEYTPTYCMPWYRDYKWLLRFRKNGYISWVLLSPKAFPDKEEKKTQARGKMWNKVSYVSKKFEGQISTALSQPPWGIFFSSARSALKATLELEKQISSDQQLKTHLESIMILVRTYKFDVNLHWPVCQYSTLPEEHGVFDSAKKAQLYGRILLDALTYTLCGEPQPKCLETRRIEGTDLHVISIL